VDVDRAGYRGSMADAWLTDTRSSYDIDASGYAEKVRGLLDDKPYLRAGLALFAELVHGAGGGSARIRSRSSVTVSAGDSDLVVVLGRG